MTACAGTLDVEGPDPVADAGFDQVRFLGDAAALDVELDARASCDPLDDAPDLGAAWTLVTAPPGANAAVSTHKDDTLHATFTAELPGEYVVSVVVKNGDRRSDPDDVEIDVRAGDGEDIVVSAPDTDACGGPVE